MYEEFNDSIPNLLLVSIALPLSRWIQGGWTPFGIGKAREIRPKPEEIIFEPQSGLYRATYVVERLSPLITAAALIGAGLP